MMSLSTLILTNGSDHPDHVTVDGDGIPYIDPAVIDRDDADFPPRFTADARPVQPVGGPLDPEAVPWPTLVFGLETGRYDLRERFLAQLRAAAAAGAELDDYGRPLAAAFHSIYGGRGVTAETPGFLAFLRAELATEPDPRVRAQLERGLRPRDPAAPPALDPRLARAGAAVVQFGAETGHVPADHVSVLYWMSALVPEWTGVHFSQLEAEPDDPDAGHPHTLEAWWAGTYVGVPAENRGDFVDPWSCAGLINVLLRDLARSDVRVFVDTEDDTVRAVAATRTALRLLRTAGAIGQPDEED